MKASFQQVFLDRLDAIEREANQIGINITVVCAEAGISRANPDRWRRELPKTIQLVHRMELVVERHRVKQIKALKGKIKVLEK